MSESPSRVSRRVRAAEQATLHTDNLERDIVQSSNPRRAEFLNEQAMYLAKIAALQTEISELGRQLHSHAKRQRTSSSSADFAQMTTLLGAHSELVSRSQLFADDGATAGDAAATLASGVARTAEAAAKTFDDTVSNWANFDVESVAAITAVKFELSFMVAESRGGSAHTAAAADAVVAATAGGSRSDVVAAAASVISESRAQPEIIAMEAQIQPPIAHVEAEALIKSATETFSVQNFLRGFAQYAELCEQRRSIFDRVRRQYPDYIQLPHADSSMMLHFAPPASACFRFKFLYSLRYRVAHKRFQPVMHMYTLAGDAFNDPRVHEGKALADAMPQRFRQLVGLKGLAPALITFCKLAMVE